MAYLSGLGTALPDNRVSQQKTMELAQALNCSSPRQKKVLRAVYEKVAIDERYSIFSEGISESHVSFDDFFNRPGPGTAERMLYFEKHAPVLAHTASQKAIQDSGIAVRDIGHVVSVSCTGVGAPGFDIALIDSLGLARDVSRTHVGFMGCHGAFNGFRVASALCQEGRAQEALVTSVELCSVHYRDGWDLRQVLGNALFADGAGAAVISSRRKTPQDWRIAAQSSYIIPNSQDAITWRVGDEGFQMELSVKIKSLIKTFLLPWLTGWLATENFKISDIRSWAVHPGGPGVLDAVQESLGLTPEDVKVSREVLRSFGNMSSATILFILQEMKLQKMPVPCVGLGFGPGLTIEAALFL